MSDARAGRGAGNQSKAYRESSFWDSIEKKKKQQQKETKEEFMSRNGLGDDDMKGGSVEDVR